LIPQAVPPTPNIISQSPLEVTDNHLMQTFIDPVMGGVVARSFALSNLASRWQTEFGEAVLAQPVVSNATPDGGTLHLVTVTGKLYDLPLMELTARRDETLCNTEHYMRQRVAPGTLTAPVTDLVPLANGLEVLCCISPDTEMTNLPTSSVIRVYDSNSPPSQIRAITVPAPLTSSVVPLGQGIVVPLANGQLAFYSPVDGTILGNPFVTRRTQDAPPRWSPMTLISRSALAGTTANDDTSLDTAILIGDASGLLRQIELATQNNRPALVMTKSWQFPIAITAKPLVCGRNILVADNTGQLLLSDYEQLTAEDGETWSLAGGSIVWGPYPCGPGAVVAVTEKNTFVTVTQADQPVASRQAKLREVPLEHGTPVGQPVALSETQLLFITRQGTLLRYDLPQDTLTTINETGITPGCGPVVVQSKILVIGTDGAIYAF
jgi:hypothetical protein